MTTYTKIVDPGNEQVEWSTDYTSLSAWEAGEQTSYSSGDIAIADCRRSTSAKDQSTCNVIGWEAGVTPKIIVHEDYRHEGKFADQRLDDNYVYIIQVSTDWHRGVQSQVDNLIIDGLIVYHSHATPSAEAVLLNGCEGNTLKNSIIRSGTVGVSFSGYGSGAHNLVNVVAYDSTNTCINDQRGDSTQSLRCYVYNCLAFGSATGVNRGSGTVIKNTIACNNTTDFSGTALSGTDKNVSSDATAPGTTTATNKTSYSTYFEDHSNGDFHLKDTGDNLFGISGDDLSAYFTTDIDGDTRSAWDVGPDEYVSAGSTILPIIMNQMNQFNGGTINV